MKSQIQNGRDIPKTSPRPLVAELRFKPECVFQRWLSSASHSFSRPNQTPYTSWITNPSSSSQGSFWGKSLGAANYLPTDLLLEVLLFLLLLLFIQMGPAGHWQLLDQPFHLPALLLPLLCLQLFEAAPVIDHTFWTWVGGEHGGDREEWVKRWTSSHLSKARSDCTVTLTQGSVVYTL